jgi:iron-sulfur cluster assembly protein|tara:strand:+ start:1294 stop:1620 length:327 start_codon:yes stop_codon:yes gene_type:complete
MAITMTEAAKGKIRTLLLQRQTPDYYLRIGLQGGGCSGFMYNYKFAEQPDKKDKIFEFEDIKICIDVKSYLFLNGMEVDYEEDLFKSGLVFNAPSAKRTCGCGESVAF